MRQMQKWGAALLLAATLAIVGIGPAAVAQTPESTPAAATAPATPEEKPDVVALTFPLPNGQYMISMVYPGKVQRSLVESRAKRLLTITGWQGGNFEYEDKAIDGVAAQWEGGKAPVMSSVTFLVSGAPLNPVDGTIVLESFLLAMRDLNTVHLTFATPSNFVYHGPKQHKNEAVEISCSAGQGSVSCVAKINDHTAEKLNLPLVGVEETGDALATDKSKGAMPKVPVVTIVFAFLAAMTAGIGVFLLARRIVTR